MFSAPQRHRLNSLEQHIGLRPPRGRRPPPRRHDALSHPPGRPLHQQREDPGQVAQYPHQPPVRLRGGVQRLQSKSQQHVFVTSHLEYFTTALN